jgi:hypothetical protein
VVGLELLFQTWVLSHSAESRRIIVHHFILVRVQTTCDYSPFLYRRAQIRPQVKRRAIPGRDTGVHDGVPYGTSYTSKRDKLAVDLYPAAVSIVFRTWPRPTYIISFRANWGQNAAPADQPLPCRAVPERTVPSSF